MYISFFNSQPAQLSNIGRSSYGRSNNARQPYHLDVALPSRVLNNDDDQSLLVHLKDQDLWDEVCIIYDVYLK